MTWAERLLEDEGEREQAAREFTLRAIRRGADPINHWIVRTAYTESSVTLEELEGDLGITRATLSERVNDLVQVGLLERSVEGDAAAYSTTKAQRLLGWEPTRSWKTAAE